MIEALLGGEFGGLEIHHVRMSFSGSIEEVGRPSVRKVLHLGAVIVSILKARLRYRPRVLYYPPAGPDRIPVYRDMAILLATRWLFPTSVFHFHAGGVADLRAELSRPARWLFDRAYGEPEVAILLSDLNPPDGQRLRAKHVVVIPYGIADHSSEVPSSAVERGDRPPRILFVGALRESKGVLVLLEALAVLQRRGATFRAEFVGAWASDSFRATAQELVELAGLRPHVEFAGPLVGDEKWQAYARADVFCFPTFYEAETFGVVLLEAMQFGLPVVATRWRGIPSIVRDGETGYLVEPRDASALADQIAMLLSSPALRAALGDAGRTRFLQEYTLETWHRRMENVFVGADRTP